MDSIKSFFTAALKLMLLIGMAGALFLFIMRFADGPWGVVQGGPFSSGELVSGQENWSFIKERDTVEFQLLKPPSSRTTWIMEHANRVFIPSGYMRTSYGKIWKKWPIHAEKDGRSILRVDGKLFQRKLIRVEEDPILPQVLAELSRKYTGGGLIPVAEVYNGSLWIFELTER
jgi:hypothetical protein